MRGQGGQHALVTLLSGLVDEVSAAALRHCERFVPQMEGVSPEERAQDLAAVRYAMRLRLATARDDGADPEQDEAPLRSYLRDVADRGVPLDLQLQLTRRIVAFALQSFWRAAGPGLTDQMLAFSAHTSTWHRRLEQLVVDVYCQRMGTTADEQLRRGYADALLTGNIPTPHQEQIAYTVLVLPPDRAAAPSISAVDPSVLHTVHHDHDVVLVPRHPDSAEVVRKILAIAARGDRGAATAVAETPADVPLAHRDARRLLDVRGALTDPPPMLTLDDALPESLLGADERVTRRLAGRIDVLVANRELLRTLAVFLDADMDRTLAARQLFIHRRTLTQRLQRIRALTGYDPRTTRGVQVLGLALAAHRLVTPLTA